MVDIEARIESLAECRSCGPDLALDLSKVVPGTYPVYMDKTTFVSNAHVEIADGDLVITIVTPGITLGKRRLRHQLRIWKQMALWYKHKPNQRTDMYLRSLIHDNASVRLLAYLFIRFNLICTKI